MTAPPAGALPSLPEPDFLSGNCNIGESAYTAEQMREYALLAALRLREWIPVSERLPERDGLGAVLAFDADRSCKGVWLETSHPTWWGKYNQAAGEWMPNITHWMPLPAPPTADDLARVLEESATGGEAGSA